MPVKISSRLPAYRYLEQENIFVMNEERAFGQDIRPLRIAILNLMPNKITTETQLLRLLSNTPLQVEPKFVRTASYASRNTADQHLREFYVTFEQIVSQKLRFDGLIITGAPVEQMKFEDVAYWNELTTILDWAASNVFASLYICWAAQAALYYHYGIAKHTVGTKIFGIFEHTVVDRTNPLVRCFDDVFLAPHSRHTDVDREQIVNDPRLRLVAESQQAGAYIVTSADVRQTFVFGHGEYDADSLAGEYHRDIAKGMDITLPHNYYPDDDPARQPAIRWRAHSALLVANWLNYAVYQSTPYSLDALG